MNRLWIGLEDNPLAERTVLIAAPPPGADSLAEIIRTKKGFPLQCNTPEELFSSMEFGEPDFLILFEGFGSEDSGSNPVLEYIQTMPTNQRREIFVAWVGQGVKVGDRLAAFALGVNLVLPPQNLPDIAKRITNSWMEWKHLYQAYFQSRKDIIGY
ncbi:MAG: hypothetical protein AB1585_22015 [Thermodesulfobacteriota bacterium]